MTKPVPVPGLFIRYDYLWRDEHQQGRVEGAKERPCAVVVVVTEGTVIDRIIVVPITHTQPRIGAEGIELPTLVERHLGLDDARSWIIPDELNRVRWDDPGIVPATPSTWTYGNLPQPLVIRVQHRIRELASAGRIEPINRK